MRSGSVEVSFKKQHDEIITGGEFEPWITRDAITLIDSLLKPSMTGWEWGCGSSTVWLLDRVKFLYTVEHDAGWADYTRKHIAPCTGFLDKWHLQVIPNDNVQADDSRYIDCGGISRVRYCKAINKVPYGLDFIFIDGRARRGCISEAVKHLNKGGFLVLDNSDRAEYYPNAIPDAWQKIVTTNGIWETAVYKND